MWDYADVQQPKSSIIPYFISVRLPRGPTRCFPDIDSKTIESEIQEEPAISNDRDRELLCKELAAELKDRKINFVRCWFQWNFFEPRIGLDEANYGFPLDDFVSAMTAKNIEIVAVLANGYSRFLPEGINTEDSKKYVRHMVQMATAVVDHYKDSVSVWQIENEPNWWDEHYATHWRSGGMWLEPGTQDLILGALHDAVRREDPDGTIMINLEADNKKTNWSFYAKYCDVLGLDFYPNYLRSSPVDASEVKFSSEVKNATGLPVYIAETGYPSGPSFLGYDTVKQSEYVESACKESFACDDITALCLWRFSDSYWRSFPFQENYFGLLTKEGKPKPAWTTLHNEIVSSH
jgi:hypothetical protein